MTDYDPLIDSILGIDSPAPAANDAAGEYDHEGRRRPVADLSRSTLGRASSLREFRQLRREDAAVERLDPLPDAGHEIVLLMSGDFHGWDLVAAVLRLAAPATCDHLRIATLGFNREQSHHLAKLIDAGKVVRVTFLISEMFDEKNRIESQALRSLMVDRGQTVVVNRNHCKVITFAMSDGRRITIHGSANLRRCNSIEQMVIAHDAALHDFFADYIDHAAEAHA